MLLRVMPGKMIGVALKKGEKQTFDLTEGMEFDPDTIEGFDVDRILSIDPPVVAVAEGEVPVKEDGTLDIEKHPEFLRLQQEKEALEAQLLDRNATPTGADSTKEAAFAEEVDNLGKQAEFLTKERDEALSDASVAKDRNEVLANVVEALLPTSKTDWERLDEKSLRAIAAYAGVKVEDGASKADLHKALAPFKERA